MSEAERIDRAVYFLRVCASNKAGLCRECPYIKHGMGRCTNLLCKEAADVIDVLRRENAALRAQENEPLTWNERINQMTAEEKAELIEKITTECPFAVGHTRKQSCDRYEDCCLCWTEWLKSPYEPTHAPDGGKE